MADVWQGAAHLLQLADPPSSLVTCGVMKRIWEILAGRRIFERFIEL